MKNVSYEYSKSHSRENVYPSGLIRSFAQVFSFLFHPLLISTYVMGFLLYIHPAAFEGFDRHTRNLRMFSVVLFTVFFPVLSIFLAWRLRLVGKLTLESRQDRLIGFIVTMFFYFWTSYVFRSLPDTPPAAAHFVLGTFIAVCGAWMCTIFYKISLHAVAMGGLIGFFLLFGTSDPFVSGLYISLPVIIGGLVCSSRLMLGAHNRFEMVSGFFIGFFAQCIAWLF
jgi:hypothetical protein